MTILRLILSVTLLLSLAVPASFAGNDDFSRLVSELNVTARSDMPGFRGELSTTFGVDGPRIDHLMVSLGSPADAYFCLRLGQLSGRSIDEVSREFQAHRGQGWGVIAQNLGIKPGSAAFHQLKDTSKIKQRHASKGKDKGHKEDKSNGKGKK